MFEPKLLQTSAAARVLRVPAKWLRAEAEAGRIPHLRAGSVLLFDIATVERILVERAAQNESQEAANGRT
jgi:hypothetical protein